MEHDDYTAMVAIAKNDERDQLRAEITQLRAEIAAERELADRLADCLSYWKDYADYDCDGDALRAYAIRRNK